MVFFRFCLRWLVQGKCKLLIEFMASLSLVFSLSTLSPSPRLVIFHSQLGKRAHQSSMCCIRWFHNDSMSSCALCRLYVWRLVHISITPSNTFYKYCVRCAYLFWFCARLLLQTICVDRDLCSQFRVNSTLTYRLNVIFAPSFCCCFVSKMHRWNVHRYVECALRFGAITLWQDKCKIKYA